MKIAEFQNGDTHLVYERRYTCDNRYMSGTRNVLQIEEMTGIIRAKGYTQKKYGVIHTIPIHISRHISFL